jgi:hypothetical protein
MRHSGSKLISRMWRCVATSLLLLLLGALATPFVQAQDPDSGLPPCCRMMAGRMPGCSMRMHREMVEQAVEQYGHSHQLASLQPHCPCTPLVQSSVAPHDTPLAATSAELALLPMARAPTFALEVVDASRREGSEETRGPPMTLTA